MQIDPWTIGLQAINFLVLVWLLRHFLYRPVKDVIEKRKELAEHALAEAEKREAEAEAERQRFEEKRAGLTMEREEMLNALHVQMDTERSRALDEARRTAQQVLDDARAAVTKERESVLAETRQEVAALASALASSVLRDCGGMTPDSALLERLVASVNALPDAERERLGKDLEPDGARLTVVTATPIPPEDCARWRDRLGGCIGHVDKIEFATEPEVLGGAELRFPHAVLSFTWADHLRRAEERLLSHEAAS